MSIRMMVMAGVAGIVLAGCSESDEQAAAPTVPSEQDTSWKLAAMPDGAVGVGDLKKSASHGDTVVMRGTIGGRGDPISEGIAMFVLVDNELASCADMGDDHCPKPWDYCCEPKDSLTANSATVQLVGADGKVLAVDLPAHGFEPISDVIVVGTVEPRPSGDVLIIKATGIYRVDG